jgi:hypothetical protein
MRLVIIILTIIFYSSVVKAEIVFEKSWCSKISKEVKDKYKDYRTTKIALVELKKKHSLLKTPKDFVQFYKSEIKLIEDFQLVVDKFENSDWLYKTATIYNAFCKK